MKKAALAGAIALATIGTLSIPVDGIGIAPAAAQEVVVSDAVIVRLKSALRLTPEQEAHWRALEASLHRIAQHLSREEGGDSAQHVRIKSYVLDNDALDRFKTSALPLLSSLSEDQKRTGRATARALGVGSLF